MKNYYSCDEVANMYKVTSYTVRKWIRDGTIGAVRIGPKKWRITSVHLAEFEKKGKAVVS